jgi:hypothetical protein
VSQWPGRLRPRHRRPSCDRHCSHPACVTFLCLGSWEKVAKWQSGATRGKLAQLKCGDQHGRCLATTAHRLLACDHGIDAARVCHPRRSPARLARCARGCKVSQETCSIVTRAQTLSGHTHTRTRTHTHTSRARAAVPASPSCDAMRPQLQTHAAFNRQPTPCATCIKGAMSLSLHTSLHYRADQFASCVSVAHRKLFALAS